MPLFPDSLTKAVNESVIDRFGGGAFQLTHEVTNRKVQKLYEKAKRDQWNVDDIFCEPKEKELDEGMPLLNDEEVEAMCRVYSQLYYGERGAQIISAQCTELAPHNEAAKFLSTQVMDEARHVEIFERMLNSVGRIYPMNPFLNMLLTDMRRVPHWEEKIIGMNMLVEGLALSVFNQIVDVFAEHPKLKNNPRYANIVEPLRYIIKDESRHVGFAVVYLPKGLGRRLSRARKIELQTRQFFWFGLLYGSLKYHQAEAELVGVDFMAVLKRILVEHQERIDEMGIDVLIDARRLEKALPTIDRLLDAALNSTAKVLPHSLIEKILRFAAASA